MFDLAELANSKAKEKFFKPTALTTLDIDTDSSLLNHQDLNTNKKQFTSNLTNSSSSSPLLPSTQPQTQSKTKNFKQKENSTNFFDTLCYYVRLILLSIVVLPQFCIRCRHSILRRVTTRFSKLFLYSPCRENSNSSRQSTRRKSILFSLIIILFLWLQISYANSQNNSSTLSLNSNNKSKKGFLIQLLGQSPFFPSESNYVSKLKINKFAIVADLDKKSRSKSKNGTDIQFSQLMFGNIIQHKLNQSFDVELDFLNKKRLESTLNEKGRGMELSELLIDDNNRLLTFDDRTGAVFQITDEYKMKHLCSIKEGDGSTTKGQKTEQASMHKGLIYTGSFGKEYVDSKGAIVNQNNMQIAKLNQNCAITHVNQTNNFNLLRKATGTLHPNYMIIEAMVWSKHQNRWFILPRRVSHEPYDEKKDESLGSNIILSCTENFTDIKVQLVGNGVKEHTKFRYSKGSSNAKSSRRGFSSFRFLPNTNDSIVVALKTEENEIEQTQTTYLTIFDLQTGRTLLQDYEIPGMHKYEGLVFLS